jgi:hypothetical protein
VIHGIADTIGCEKKSPSVEKALTFRDDFVVSKRNHARHIVTRTVKEISLFALSSACLLVAVTMMQRSQVRLSRSGERMCWSAADLESGAQDPGSAGPVSRWAHVVVMQCEHITGTAVAVSLDVVPVWLHGQTGLPLQVCSPAFSLRAPPIA